MNRPKTNSTCWLVFALFVFGLSVPAGRAMAQTRRDSLRYPISDRRNDPYNNPYSNQFDLRDTGFIKRSIEYDPVTKQYFSVEKIGNRYYRTPMTFSMEEFLRLQGAKDESEYFRKRANTLFNLNRRSDKPNFGFNKEWMNRITGNGKIDIKPSGYVDIGAGYQGQNIKNPTLPERARRTGGFDFNMNAQLQVDANIGDKIKLPINYNTLANFDFENQLKLDYQGRDDEMLKQFSLGNVSFNNKGTLIPGATSLFGMKTQLQFGRLFVSTVLANQRSQRQSLGLQAGSTSQPFSLRADEYEENRHFLMAQYFRANYNNALKDLPIIRSNVQITKVEVWVTNRTGITTDTRDVVAFMNLGESDPTSGSTLPDNYANGLYYSLKNNPSARNSTSVQNTLTGMGMQPVQDFEKTFARKLLPSDYTFLPESNGRLGYISLNQPLQPDEVLGIAFQYTYNGKVFQVGEFSQDVPPDSSGNSQNVLFLKLLKATSQRTNLPIWKLMMKNIYSVGFGQLQREDFKLDLVYEEPSLGEKRYLPVGDTVNNINPVKAPFLGQPILTLVNLDRLNNQNDPQPNGVFDYIEGQTVVSSQSRVIFPVLEPFGRDLEYVFTSPEAMRKYVYYPLYDTIKAIAQTYANLNRYKLVGRTKQANNADYQLGFNIPRGSVTVTAGGQILQENIDYEINYDLGTLHVTNTAVINSGIPVQIQFENNATFGLQSRNYLALRLDYLASKHLTVGGTMVRLGERPFFTKQSYGEDPIRNTMYGLDFDYRNNVPRLSRLLNKLPFYSTKAMSSITAYGEAAMLDPGHAKQIGKGDQGVIYIDDFEGTRSSIDLRFPIVSWSLASTPQNAPDLSGAPLFPEASLTNDLAYNYNRAKLAWYNIENVLQERRNDNNPLRRNLRELSKPEVRQVFQNEIFPQRSTNLGQNILTTFDMAFYPREKGPYNFQSSPTAIDSRNNLTQPQKAWGGIQRNVDQTDFETGNIEFIEFWVQDPFIRKPLSTGGELYFNLGNISEDVLRDGRRQYENGLPTPGNTNAPTDNTVWGRVPRNPQQVTNAFSNETEDRPHQDLGFDGLADSAEQRQFTPYLVQLQPILDPTVFQNIRNDPSQDNFRGYRDNTFTENSGILERYKNINNPHGNSPVANNTDQFTSAFTLYPDQEELNRDNTLNETEEYFQYRIEMRPGMTRANNKYITDVREVNINPVDGSGSRKEKWYLFRVPIRDYQAKVGNIPDFKSIRFIRMFMTGFEDTVVMRFAKLELVRNQWRKFNSEIDTTGNYLQLPTNDPVKMEVLAVNVEENDQRTPIPYRTPPGILRQQQLSNNNVQLLQNEQALSLKFCGIRENQARGVFKNLNLDLRQYGKLSMFIHAERDATYTSIIDDDMNAVIRIGNDFVSNYYEIRIPLKLTPFGARDSNAIWPALNNLELELKDLTTVKSRRNRAGFSPSKYFSTTLANGKTYAIIGNPNLGEVRGLLLGVENSNREEICGEVWFNEMRLSRLDEEGGYAALGRVDLRLADLGSISVAGSMRSTGFGTLEQRVNERSREDFKQLDLSTTLDLGKLVPKKAALQIPVYAGISKTTSTPEYDPYDLDIKLKEKLRDAQKGKQDSIRNESIDQTTIKTVNFTNVKKIRTSTKPVQPWDISNIDLNYAYSHQEKSNPIIESDDIRRTRAAVGYSFAPQARFVEPLKTVFKSRSPWLAFIRDLNFNYKPTLQVKADVFRQFGALRSRNVGGDGFKLPEYFDKRFTFDRYYTMRWELTRSLLFDFNAVNNAIVDEPSGRLDNDGKKDSVRRNLLKGGRNTHYNHSGTFSYNFPTTKFPFLDWTQLQASYTAKYDWVSASLLAKELGNTVLNGQTRNGNAVLNFDQLYLKSKFLREATQPKPDQPAENKGKGKDTASKKVARPKDPKEPRVYGGFTRGMAQILTSLKRVGLQYNEDLGTLLPGYLDSTRILGMNPRSNAPGWRYILGYQPDTSDINRFGQKGLLTRDPLFNQLIQQRFNQKISLTAQLSPIRDLSIDINLDKNFDKQYSELYKDTNGTSGLQRYNPYAMGSFSVSYISYQTLFTKFDPNEISQTFKTFEQNRSILSQRLKGQNPYAFNNTVGPDGYVLGYGRYAQDVVIPAFLAAYTDKDPTTITLIKHSNPKLKSNPFAGILPKPNWSITYNGLSRIKGLEKIFSNVTIRHGYNSTLGMNSFNTSLLFQDSLRVGYPKFRDSLTGNFIPYFLVPNVTISEQFAPLLEVDMTFTNQLSARVEFKKSRTLSLSLLDYQLAENRSTEYTIGLNWRRRGMPIFKNLKIGKNAKPLDNDMTFRFDFSVRDDATSNSKLDQNIANPAGGQKVIRISPTIDYVVNNRVNLKFYFEQNRVIPTLATTAPITTTRAGVQVRVSLAQ